MDVNAASEFDGFLHYTVKITALEDAAFNDIIFKSNAAFISKIHDGLGQKGGDRLLL